MKFVVSFLLLCFSLVSHANPLNQVVVFGDSLSDRGNLYEHMNHQLPMSPPYYEGRFTNGPVWVELLIQRLYPKDFEAHFIDYAFGGANVATENQFNDFSLQNQVKKYFNEHGQANPDALYVVWAGSNNYLDLPDNIPNTCQQVIAGIEESIESLIQKGGKNFFVVNVPDLSTTPAAMEFDSQDDLKQMSDTHNRMLFERIAALKAKYPDVRWVVYDVTEIMGDIIVHPDAHGFKDGVHTCCEFMQDALMNAAPLNQQVARSKFLSRVNATAFAHLKDDEDFCYDYLFFDLYHPTAHAHQLMAQEIYDVLVKNHFTFE